MCWGKDPRAAKDTEGRRNIRESWLLFFLLLSMARMEWELRHRGLGSRDLNLINLSGGGGRQRKEDHGDKRGRARKRRKEITLQPTGDGCALSDSGGQKWNICLRGGTPVHYEKNKKDKTNILCFEHIHPCHCNEDRQKTRKGKDNAKVLQNN